MCTAGTPRNRCYFCSMADGPSCSVAVSPRVSIPMFVEGCVGRAQSVSEAWARALHSAVERHHAKAMVVLVIGRLKRARTRWSESLVARFGAAIWLTSCALVGAQALGLPPASAATGPLPLPVSDGVVSG